MARSDFIDDDWNIDEIYTGPAKDQQGHSINARCHMPDHWMAAIQELISHTPQFPEYKRSPQAFIRDAVFHRLAWANRQKNRGDLPLVREQFAVMAAERELTHKAMVRERYVSLIEKMDQTFRDAIYDGDKEGVRELAEYITSTLDDYPEPYRTKLRDKLQDWSKRAIG